MTERKYYVMTGKAPLHIEPKTLAEAGAAQAWMPSVHETINDYPIVDIKWLRRRHDELEQGCFTDEAWSEFKQYIKAV